MTIYHIVFARRHKLCVSQAVVTDSWKVNVTEALACPDSLPLPSLIYIYNRHLVRQFFLCVACSSQFPSTCYSPIQRQKLPPHTYDTWYSYISEITTKWTSHLCSLTRHLATKWTFLSSVLTLVSQPSKRHLRLTHGIHTCFTSESSFPGSGSDLPFEPTFYSCLSSSVSSYVDTQCLQLPWHHPIGGTETPLIN